MPIGYEAGAMAGGALSRTQNPRNAGKWVGTRVTEQVARWELMERGRDVAEWFEVMVPQLYPVPWLAWHVHPDERLCPECSIYSGDRWEEDTWHPSPPLHVNCRCREGLSHIEWRTRWVSEWRLRWRRESWFEWDVTYETRDRWDWTYET